MKVFANRPDLVIRHKKFINMLKWEEIDPSAKLTPASSCTIDCGIIDDTGKQRNLPACIYIDNALMLALNADHMKMVLAVGGPVLKSVKKLLQTPFLELYHVYIYYMTSHV